VHAFFEARGEHLLHARLRVEVVDHSYPGASCPRVLDQQLDGVRGVGSNPVIANGDELALGGQLDVLEMWGVLEASRTDGDAVVRHGFMVAGQSDRYVPATVSDPLAASGTRPKMTMPERSRPASGCFWTADWTTMEWVPPKPRLQSGDIALRPFQANDAAAVASACRDQDILRFTFMKDGLTETEAREWIETGSEWWPKGHPRFAVVDAHDDHLLGQVGLNFNPRHVSAEAHYWVDASERGRGAASRALSLIIDWGFSKGIERAFVLIHPENKPSNRVAAKLGFTREGVLRSYEPVKDRRPDLVSWSLLPSDPRPWHERTTGTLP
jgi:[ribosomal protein S5]-alanine N-acetyltransferase